MLECVISDSVLQCAGWPSPLSFVAGSGRRLCTAIAEIVRKLPLISGVRPSSAAATSARLEVQDYFHTCSRPTFLRPRTGALRLVAASPRCAGTILLVLSSILHAAEEDS